MTKHCSWAVVGLLLLANVNAAADSAITSRVWQEAVVSVTDIDQSARIFLEIGGYEQKWRGPVSRSELASWGLNAEASGEALLLGPANTDDGFVRLIRFDEAGRKEPTRPGSRAWDTGCYFSLMVRVKDMEAVYDDAIAMGWWSETPITKLQFGDSLLNVIIFRGPDGLQLQGYERLSLPIPPAFPDFERISGPFNMMQMVSNRDATYEFFTSVLGFDTFYNGQPYVSDEPEFMPLGIPKNLTTEVRYRAGIVYPVAGERGRMEMIEIMDLDGRDFSARCDAPNLGILAVRFEVDDVEAAAGRLGDHDVPLSRDAHQVALPPYGDLRMIAAKTPDGANVQFFERGER